jgi:large subunit ribosomal protein L25
MEAFELVAQIREEKGKSNAARLRRDGLLPCVLYGSEIDAIPLTVKTAELDRILREGGANVLIKVKVDSQEYITLVREVQYHPVAKDYLHADLQRISMKDKLQTFVPLVIVGESPGVEQGGVLQQQQREVEVECLPTNIPEYIEVDISELDFGESITAQDLNAGPDVEIITEADTVIVSVVAPQAEEEPAEDEGAEVETAEPERIGEEEKEEEE